MRLSGPVGALMMLAVIVAAGCADEALSSTPISAPVVNATTPNGTSRTTPGRPAATSTTEAAPVPGKVFMVGDSVMESTDPDHTNTAEEIIGAAGWDITMDALKNRKTSEGRAIVKTNLKKLPDTVVIMLGHNDDQAKFADEANAMLDLLAGVDRVYWLTMVEPRFAKANATLRSLQADHPNLHLIDWASQVRKDWMVSDGLHLREIGSENLAKVILAGLSDI